MRALFLECNLSFWVEVARVLAHRHRWNIVGWVSTPDIGVSVRRDFPQIFFVSTWETRVGLAGDDRDVQGGLFSQAAADDYAADESVLLKMMDRLDLDGSFSLAERRRLYHRMFDYWSSVLDRLAPEVIVFPTSPHMVYDYLVYVLARRRGIETVMFLRTAVPGMLLAQRRLYRKADGWSRFLRFAADRESDDRASIEQYLARVRGGYSNGMPDHVQFKLEHYGKRGERRSGGSVATRLARGVCKTVSTVIGWFGGSSLSPVGVFEGRVVVLGGMARGEFARYRVKRRWARRRIRRAYESVAETVDLTRPFVFVALQCQPERSTSPDGGVFVDQELMVATLSAAMPKGWKLYVKEHISQFQPYQRAEMGRDAGYYERLKSIPGVHIVPLSVSSFELIDASRAVAGVGGSVGWEAAVRGTPALVFGETWYDQCPGVFSVHDLASCRAAFRALREGEAPEREAVDDFLRSIAGFSIRGYVDPIYELKGPVTYRENVESIAAALSTLANRDSRA